MSFSNILTRCRAGRAALPLSADGHPREVGVLLQRPRRVPGQVRQRHQERRQVPGHQGAGLGLHELQTQDHQTLRRRLDRFG